MARKKNASWFKELAGYSAGDYILDNYVGCGKIGHVYRGHHRDFPGEWAVKLTADLPDGWETELKKVTTLSRIAGVVQFHGAGVAKITHKNETKLFQYSVWDYIPPGRNLGDYLREHKTVPASFLLAVVERVLTVLHACQTKGIARHGDLHAGNILIGDEDPGDLDQVTLKPRAPVYVSDFGYGATGGKKTPKDDYAGLARIIDELIQVVDWDAGTPVDRHLIQSVAPIALKFLREKSESERVKPLDLLQLLRDSARQEKRATHRPQANVGADPTATEHPTASVGHFLVSEMLGDSWYWWDKLFVATVPGRTRILDPGLPTVLTGPRGCGKTMLFRRLSSRVVVECGSPDGPQTNFPALYINANDFADPFPSYDDGDESRNRDALICYANLCALADFLAVIQARQAKFGDEPAPQVLTLVEELLVAPGNATPMLSSENLVDRLRYVVERIKWKFRSNVPDFPAAADMVRHTWLPRFIKQVRPNCSWLADRPLLLFVDDFTTPRVTPAMQRTLNRLLFQRSSEYVAKVATESVTTFVPEDSTGKVLQDGDDYQLIDMGEESLFMSEKERAVFLDAVFARRLAFDPRLPDGKGTLEGLLGKSRWNKTEFARLLRQDREGAVEETTSARRGATRARVLYQGAESFHALWSGDTRMMIQLVQDLLDEASVGRQAPESVPLDDDLQDRVLRNRGSQWLEAHTRSQPTDRAAVDREFAQLQRDETFDFVGGSYGTHLKGVVEAFVTAARKLLLEAPPYIIIENGKPRSVPRMAFRIEILDEFRLDGLARQIYSDLVRYGLFLRDPRGKSVRGAMVPRLYLRRLLLPYAALALSKRDSVPLTCAEFRRLLTRPDQFRVEFERSFQQTLSVVQEQEKLPFASAGRSALPTAVVAAYDDIEGDVDVAAPTDMDVIQPAIGEEREE